MDVDQEIVFVAADDIKLERSESGDTYATIQGARHRLGHILSVFPISNKNHYASLRDEHGNELGVVDQAHELDPDSRRLLREELERSYFLPRITDIISIVNHLSIFTFEVDTDRGFRSFEVRNPRQNVRSVGGGRYIIKDVDGNRYDIPKLRNLGPKSQNLMIEFV